MEAIMNLGDKKALEIAIDYPSLPEQEDWEKNSQNMRKIIKGVSRFKNERNIQSARPQTSTEGRSKFYLTWSSSLLYFSKNFIWRIEKIWRDLGNHILSMIIDISAAGFDLPDYVVNRIRATIWFHFPVVLLLNLHIDCVHKHQSIPH